MATSDSPSLPINNILPTSLGSLSYLMSRTLLRTKYVMNSILPVKYTASNKTDKIFTFILLPSGGLK